jgi:hypothetical protein
MEGRRYGRPEVQISLATAPRCLKDGYFPRGWKNLLGGAQWDNPLYVLVVGKGSLTTAEKKF